MREIPKRQRRPLAKPLEHYAARYAERDRTLAQEYRSGAYSTQAIAEYFGISHMTVSRAVKYHEDKRSSTDGRCETCHRLPSDYPEGWSHSLKSCRAQLVANVGYSTVR